MDHTVDIIGVTPGSMLEKVWQLVSPVCETEGLELIYVEFQSEREGKVLRLYLDRPEGATDGVTIDDCVRVSRQVDDLLAVYIDESQAYRLEVSSAGIDRPLARRSDFERFKGCRVKIKTQDPVEGRRNFSGTLRGIADGQVRVDIEEKEWLVPFNRIKKAQLVAENNGVNG